MAKFSFIKQNKKGNYTISAFTVCLIIAVVFWLLNTLGKNYSHLETFDVVYEKMPFNKQPANPLPTSVQITFEGKGFDLLWLAIRKPFKNLKIAIPASFNSALQGRFKVSVAESFLKQYGNNNQNLKVSFTEPDSIYFVFTDKLTKKIPVIFHADISYKKRYGSTKGIDPETDSITIAGSKEALASVTGIETVPLTLQNLSSTTHARFQLINPDSTSIFLSRNSVDAVIDVEEITESTVSVAVVPPFSPGRVLLVPSSVSVTYNSTLHNVKKISAGDFLITAIPSDKKGYAIPVIKKQPANASVVFINPPLVQVLEEK